MASPRRLSKAEEAQDGNHDYYQPDYVNDVVHGGLLGGVLR
jgi:hypothetical protein